MVCMLLLCYCYGFSTSLTATADAGVKSAFVLVLGFEEVGLDFVYIEEHEENGRL